MWVDCKPVNTLSSNWTIVYWVMFVKISSSLECFAKTNCYKQLKIFNASRNVIVICKRQLLEKTDLIWIFNYKTDTKFQTNVIYYAVGLFMAFRCSDSIIYLVRDLCKILQEALGRMWNNIKLLYKFDFVQQ